MSMGTHIVLMHQGKIMQQGTPYEIYHNPDNVFTAQFIGTPPMNILEMNRDFNIDSCPYLQAAYAGFRPNMSDCSEMGKRQRRTDYDSLVLLSHMKCWEQRFYTKSTQHMDASRRRSLMTEKQSMDRSSFMFHRDKIVYFDEQQQRLR